MGDNSYQTWSLQKTTEGVPDQYEDGKAAKLWNYYIGCAQTRTENYKTWICDMLNGKHCRNVLDVACGTGIDSILLVKEGFSVTSTDVSDKMLKYALEERWNQRKEECFDKWVIKEANWLNLVENLKDTDVVIPDGGFDALICLGNSISQLLDFEGKMLCHRQALENFRELIKPGGILLIDHRNYDEVLATGSVPAKNIYYNSKYATDIRCSILYVDGKPVVVTSDYTMDLSTAANDLNKDNFKLKHLWTQEKCTQKYSLSNYPIQLHSFSQLLKDVFGPYCQHDIFGDFQPIGVIEKPSYYIHVVQKI